MYAVVNLGAFAVVALASVRGEPTVDDYRAARVAPLARWLASAFALLCLAGLPPGIVGLFAKVVVFQGAVDAGLGWLAVVMAVNVVIGLFYYLRFLVVLLRPVPAGQHLGATSDGAGAEQDDDWEGLDPDVPWSTEFVVGVTLAAALVLSVFPGLLFAAVSP